MSTSTKDRRRDVWMTAEEAAAYLGYRTRDALYQAVRRGHVPAHHLGPRGLRFRRGELDAKLVGQGASQTSVCQDILSR